MFWLWKLSLSCVLYIVLYCVMKKFSDSVVEMKTETIYRDTIEVELKRWNWDKKWLDGKGWGREPTYDVVLISIFYFILTFSPSEIFYVFWIDSPMMEEICSSRLVCTPSSSLVDMLYKNLVPAKPNSRLCASILSKSVFVACLNFGFIVFSIQWNLYFRNSLVWF